MHSNVIIKNVTWPHFSWPTLYVLCLVAAATLLFGYACEFVIVAFVGDSKLILLIPFVRDVL